MTIALCAAVTTAKKEHKSRVSQIIILMMENRSFDHLLGYVEGVDGIGNAPATTPVDPTDPSQGTVPIKDNGYDVSPDDPNHDIDAIAIQINGGAMNGFIKTQVLLNQNITNPVAMFDQQSAPIINTLAKEYAVFDRWFCSLPGPTDPNRQFAMSGTSQGITTNFNGTLYTQQSYIDYLRVNDVTSGGYYQNDLWQLGAYEDLMHNHQNAKNIKELDAHFYKDLAAGQLPTFTWLQPSMTAEEGSKGPSWQHPDASVREGERLIKQLYESIRASPKWEETLFVITYDEHGGFYDHVTPPSGVPAPSPGISCVDCADNSVVKSYDFTTLGVRVPTIAISPWIAKGQVISKGNGTPSPNSAYESTSVMATVNELLDVQAAPLSDRMAWAARFTHLITESPGLRTDCPTTLPALPDTDPEYVRLQRTKPINEHLMASMLMFCKQNYPHEFEEGKLCASAAPHATNQGTISDWLHTEQKAFMKKRSAKFDAM